MKTSPPLTAFGLAITVLLFIAAPSVQAQFWPTPIGQAATTATPYWAIGRISFQKKDGNDFIGSGTVLRPYSVLTAGHCVYDGVTGWIQSGTFDLGYYQGDSRTSNPIVHLWLVGGYTSHAAKNGYNSSSGFSYDAGAVVCSGRPLNGGYAGWWQNPALLTGRTYNMSVGYGAENGYTGEELLKSAPSKSFKEYSGGTGAYYSNSSYRIAHGMSGGPVFAYTKSRWYVCAINVSGSNTVAGVHSVDSNVSSLIKKHLY